MQKFFAALALAGMLGFSGAALAEEASGKIQAVDAAAKTLQLEDGTTFMVAEGVAIDQLQPGTEVTVSYEVQGDQNVATSITPAAQ